MIINGKVYRFDVGKIKTQAHKKLKNKIVKEKGYLYFVDEEGDISRIKILKGKEKGIKEKVKKVGIMKRAGFLYYVDKNLNIREVQSKQQRNYPIVNV